MIDPAQSVAKTNVRYLILVMIFIVTVFNYVDRAAVTPIAIGVMINQLGSFDVALPVEAAAVTTELTTPRT